MTKITNLTGKTTLTGTEEFAVNDSGADKKVTSNAIRKFIVVNLKDFGAVGDGSTDDTSAFSAFLSVVVSGAQGYIPSGTYKITTRQVVAVWPACVVLFGDGPEKSILQFIGVGGLKVDAITPGGPPNQNVNLSNFCIKGDVADNSDGGTGGTSGAIGLELDGCDRWFLSNMMLRNFGGNNLLLDGSSVGTSLNSTIMYSADVGVRIQRHNGGGNGPSDSNTFMGGYVQLNGKGGLLIDECDDNKFIGVQFVRNGIQTISAAGEGNAVAVCGAYDNKFIGSFFEQSGDYHAIVRNGLGIQPTSAQAAFGTTFIANHFVGTSGTRVGGVAGDIHITSATQETYIAGNQLNVSINNAGTNTRICKQAIVGTGFSVTDTGAGTSYDLTIAGVKRQVENLVGYNILALKLEIGDSYADFNSSGDRIRFGGVKSIGSSTTLGKNLRGNFQVNNTSTTGTVTFSDAEPDSNYYLVITPVSTNGSPVAGSAYIDSVSKSTSGFTVTMQSAPGSGNGRSYDWVLIR